MIITLWWGYLLAHPATLFVWGTLAAACVLALAAYLRLTGEQGAHHASRHAKPPRRAGRMTRAGRRITFAWARRLPGAIAWTWRTPIRAAQRTGPGDDGDDDPDRTSVNWPRPTWARKAIGHRIQALRTWWAFTRPRRQPSTEERQAMALLQQMRDEDTGGFLALPAAGVTVKIGAGDVRAAGRTLGMPVAPPGLCPDCARDMDAEQHQIGCPGLDEPLPPDPCSYQPAPPLASMLSDETIARGMQAVTP